MLGIWTYILLFGSGLSALAYQVVWMREFRLVFGASTASTAAVSALFMAGLGVGGWLLGPRADRDPKPLLLYAKLEGIIAVIAGLSPLLLMLTRAIYLKSGGMMVLGMWGATVARLLLAAVVLGVPTILMGGTLPAAVRAVTSESDGSRRSLGLLYGVNTIGALVGVVLTNFWLLEHLGARNTLFVAVALNLVVAGAAKAISDRMPALVSASRTDSPSVPDAAGSASEDGEPGLPSHLALAAAAVAGFAFFLMELVWYRMLSPVLGGSTYTFGLILAVALAGIGIGGALYPLVVRNRRPSAAMLAVTCLLEALCMMIPYAIGDWLAAFASQTQGLAALGFLGIVLEWTLVTLVVVFPAAIISGVQFPLLIALLGRGTKDIGRQTGRAYASNTAGSIVGSLAGGFGLIPWLTATGCWLLAGALLSVLGLVIAFSAVRNIPDSHWRARARTLGGVGVILILLACCFRATGPTAAWRHSPIGAGRVNTVSATDEILAWMAIRRWNLAWEEDGVESSIGIMNDDGFSFFVNGKSDGNIIGDRGTQIMCGLVGSALHPAPKKSLVVGLGTGCTAGWLAAVEGMERVDVVELEPAVLHMAALCASANQDILLRTRSGGNVRIIINDAREVLNTVPERYDVIASEPSNPYRAGIASLFTREFYEQVRDRLAPGGIFVTWCQAYEIDTETVFTIMATLKTVFPHVECWTTQRSDLVFVTSMEPIRPNAAVLAKRLAEPPYGDAMRAAWGTEGLEGFVGRFIASNEFVDQAVKAHEGGINTDDLMKVEYDYARTVGHTTRFSMNDLFEAARARNMARPDWLPENVNEDDVLFQWSLLFAYENVPIQRTKQYPEYMINRISFLEMWRQGQFAQARQRHAPPVRPLQRAEHLALAECLADAGDDEALAYAEKAADWWPGSAAVVRARLAMRKNAFETAAAELETAFAALRASAWEMGATMGRGIALAEELVTIQPQYAQRMLTALAEPFNLSIMEARRRAALLHVAGPLGVEAVNGVLVRWFEPESPRTKELLVLKARVYRDVGSPLAGRALAEFHRYVSQERSSVEELLGKAEAKDAAE